MKQSESIALLATALCAAQSEMGGAVKDSANPFFKSKYADLGSVVKAIKEPFTKHGLSYVQFPHTDDRGIGVVTRLIHTSGEWLESEFTLPMVKHDPQAAGAAITYARRYALQSMAGIPTADDDAESAMFRTSDEPPYTAEEKATFDMLIDSDAALEFLEFMKSLSEDTQIALHNTGEPKLKEALKKKCAALESKAHKILDLLAGDIGQQVLQDDIHALHLATEAFAIGKHVKAALWGRLSIDEQNKLVSMRDAV